MRFAIEQLVKRNRVDVRSRSARGHNQFGVGIGFDNAGPLGFRAMGRIDSLIPKHFKLGLAGDADFLLKIHLDHFARKDRCR